MPAPVALDPFQLIRNVNWPGGAYLAEIHVRYIVTAGNYTTGALQGGIGFQTQQHKLQDDVWVAVGTPERLNAPHEGSQDHFSEFFLVPLFGNQSEGETKNFNLPSDSAILDRGVEDSKIERKDGTRFLFSAGLLQMTGVSILLSARFWKSVDAYEQGQAPFSNNVVVAPETTGPDGEFIAVLPITWIEFQFKENTVAFIAAGG